MLKGRKVGRETFEQVFSSVGPFYANVDYTQTRVLSFVDEADEKHDGKIIQRVNRKFPQGTKTVAVRFVRPWQREMSLGQALVLGMDYGYMPATEHETSVSLREATPGQIKELFYQAQSAIRARGLARTATSVSIPCTASAVAGETGELIPFLEVFEVCGCSRLCRLHLQKPNFDASIPPAQSIALVSVN